MARTLRHLLAAIALVVVGGSAPTAAGGASRGPGDETVHLNEIQVIGTHNSYHGLATDPERILLRQFLGDSAAEFDYYHRALDIQFQSEKVRQIELDVYRDTPGGTYASPLIRNVAGGGPYYPEMEEPGIKVLHAQDVDYHSNCLALVDCLSTIKAWSDANPTHMPIAILIELKDDIIDTGTFEFVHPEIWDTPSMDELDAEIRSVFNDDSMITPDDIRGSRATLEEAVLTDGWPTLAASRGKVMFMMDNAGDKRTSYLTDHPSLKGRVLFTDANPGDDDAAFVKRNDAFATAEIADLVKKGYVVRTRSDSPGGEAVSGDTATLTAALASGAQWVSTDYPVPGYSDGFGTDYVAEIPGGTVGRCNPVNAPAGCDSATLDTVFTAADRPAGVFPPIDTPVLVTVPPTTAPVGSPGPPTAPPATPVYGPARFTG